MIRFILWFLVWAVFLFFIDIEVKHNDVLTITFNGWGTRLENWLKNREGKENEQ